MKRIAFIVQLPKGVSPGQRFRFELWEPVLKENGFETTTYSFLDSKTYEVLYKEGKYLRKIAGVVKGYFNRIFLLFRLKKFDYVFLQREFAPLGPPVFEWFVAKIMRAKVVYDFDDAIWIPNISSSNKIASWAKCTWKVKYICRWSYKVAGGNAYLCEFARQYNKQVLCIPTCVDTDKGHGKVKADYIATTPVIGWTGSHSTLPYLYEVLPVLQRLQQQTEFCFVVIADKDPALPLKKYRFVPWQAASENEDLLQLDIGIMPLRSDAWSEGKCGFKLIQYFAAGIPAVASPVGVNKQIIEGGINGFLCSSEDEWEKALTTLLKDSALRQRMGKAGRVKVVEQYSVISQREQFLRLFA